MVKNAFKKDKTGNVNKFWYLTVFTPLIFSFYGLAINAIIYIYLLLRKHKASNLVLGMTLLGWILGAIINAAIASV